MATSGLTRTVARFIYWLHCWSCMKLSTEFMSPCIGVVTPATARARPSPFLSLHMARVTWGGHGSEHSLLILSGRFSGMWPAPARHARACKIQVVEFRNYMQKVMEPNELYKSESSQNMKVQNALQRKWWYRTHVACTYMAYTSSAASLVLVPSIFVNLSCVGFFLALKKLVLRKIIWFTLEPGISNAKYIIWWKHSEFTRIPHFSPHLLPLLWPWLFAFHPPALPDKPKRKEGGERCSMMQWLQWVWITWNTFKHWLKTG